MVLGDIQCLTVSIDGRYAITGGSDCSIKLIDVMSKAVIHSFERLHNSKEFLS